MIRNGRCNDPKRPQYIYYGGRGIKVNECWNCMQCFENFLEDMGERPEGTTLDRIEVDGDYHKDNCTWSNASDQNRNRRPYKRNKKPSPVER